MTDDTTKDLLVSEYSPKLSERQKAAIEAKLWELQEDKSSVLREVYLSSLLGDKAYNIRNRGALYFAGEAASVLFDRLDSSDMPSGTAVRVLREARARAKALGKPVSQGIKDILEEYDSCKVVSRHKSGKVVRKRSCSTLRSFDSTLTGHEGKKTKKSEEESSNATMWITIRDFMAKEMAKRLIGVDKSVADSLWREIEIDLKVVLDTAQRKLYLTKKRELSGVGNTVAIVSRQEIIHSCRTLHMDPPKVGSPVDMKLARKMKYKLASLYHPDKNGGREDSRPRYEEVLNAFSTLERYMNRNG